MAKKRAELIPKVPEVATPKMPSSATAEQASGNALVAETEEEKTVSTSAKTENTFVAGQKSAPMNDAEIIKTIIPKLAQFDEKMDKPASELSAFLVSQGITETSKIIAIYEAIRSSQKTDDVGSGQSDSASEI